ncbi:hypothetical protein PSTG_18530, partial [Puccinia striiformis f. sp. tritici PST-78]
MSQEDAEARAPDCLPASFIEGVGDSVWKTQLAASEELLGWIPEQADEIEAEVVVRYLNKKPGPKREQTFKTVSVILEYGDDKIKEAAGNALIAFAEKTSL